MYLVDGTVVTASAIKHVPQCTADYDGCENEHGGLR